MAGEGICHRLAGLVAQTNETPQTDDPMCLEERAGMLDAVSACLHKPQAAAEWVRRRYEADVNRAMARFAGFDQAGQQDMTAMDFALLGKRAPMRAAIEWLA
jgi:hypothetical protein